MIVVANVGVFVAIIFVNDSPKNNLVLKGIVLPSFLVESHSSLSGKILSSVPLLLPNICLSTHLVKLC
ncbi:hypothetical protein ACSBR2_035631 [Camellia fascicularis]